MQGRSEYHFAEGKIAIQRDGDEITLTSPGLVSVASAINLDAKVVHRHLRLFGGLYNRRETFPFALIAGIGLKEYIDTDDRSRSYLPALTLLSGRRRYLAVFNARRETYGPIVDELVRLTGLPRIDHKGNAWGW